MKHLLTKILMMCVFGSLMIAQTNINGIISINTTWSKSNNPYIFTGNVKVDNGTTLTIEPGVRVNLSEFFFEIDGTLRALGEINDSIYFSGNNYMDLTESTAFDESSSPSIGTLIEYAIFTNIHGDASIKVSNAIMIRRSSISSTEDTFYAYGTAIIKQNNISGGRIVVYGNPLITENIINGNSRNDLIYNTSGASATISKNWITGSSGTSHFEGGIRIDGGSPTITNNVITDNANGIAILGGTPNITGNNIYGNSNYNITLSYYSTNVTATGNWWGTADTSDIPSLIYDYNDDFTLGKVNYNPILSAQNITAPISPPTNVVKRRTSGNYVISWSANTESDLAGYKLYYGGYTGYSFSNSVDAGNVTSYTLSASALGSSDSIAITAYDSNANGIDDQVEGYESWFTFAKHGGPVWHVSKSGSDDNDGSEDSPFITIQKGIDSASSGDTIRVGAHIIDPAPLQSHFYSKITITDKNLTILSDSGPDSTKIDGGGTERPVTITGTSAVTMKGFSITNGLSDEGGGIYISSTGAVKFDNLHVYNNSVTNKGGGIYSTENTNVHINSCKIYNNIAVGEGGGIINKDSLIVQNSLIYNNESQQDGGGISSQAPLILISSTLAHNFIPDGRYGPALTIGTGLDSLLLFNNIFYGNYRGSTYDGGEHGVLLGNGRLVAYNNYFQEKDSVSNTANISRGDDNIFSDTQPVISPISSSDDFNLKNTSSAIGAGISSVTLNGTTYSTPSTDYIGAERPQPEGTNPDMGAIENSLGVASAKTITVKTDGTGDYTVIQTAISAANDGDTILVYPGTYTENINFNGKNIVVGSPYLTTQDTSYISNTIIDGNQAGSVVTFESGETSSAVLSGFTVQNGSASHGGGISVDNSSQPNLTNLTIRNNTATSTHTSLGGGGLYIGGYSGVMTISNMKIIDNSSSSRAGGVWIGNSDPTFTNVLIANNFSDNEGGGIATYIGTNPTLINTSIINNSSNGGAGGIFNYNTTDMVIKNSIISGNSSTQIRISSQPQIQNLSVSNSLIEGGQSDIIDGGNVINWGEGNIDSDPLFVDSENGDYNLQVESPCINAGDPDLDGDGITWETDTDDQDPDGSRMDMGYAPRSCQLDQCGVCDHDTSNDCIMDCAGAWGGDAELDCLGICEGSAILDDCGDCNGENENMDECGVCYALYSCNPFVLSNEKDTISLKVDTLRFTFSIPMDTLTFSAISLASTEIDNIQFHTSQEADSIRTLTLLIDSPLVSRDTLTLTFPATMQSSYGYPFDGNQDGTAGDGQTITLYTETLADYNHDNAIDFDDMTTFIASWYADDYDKELGPVTGTAPHMIPTFDNVFDIEDIITFMLMWNWANDFIPTPAGRIKDSGIPPNIVLQDGILQLDLSEYLENIAAVRIQLSTLDPKVKVVLEGIQSPFDITLLRSWEEDNIYEWNFGNPQGKHFDVVQLCHLETMQKQNLHLVIDYEIISTNGNILSSGRTALDHIVIPNEYALQQAYPNPFNPITQIQYALPEDIHVELIIYDILGRQVAELVNLHQQAGYQKVIWNGDQNASGLYFVKMVAGDYISTQKLMLVK